MEPLLYLVHRIPYPPNKGDKIRSFHLLRFLASRYRVFLATFVDNADDRAHSERLSDYCAGFMAAKLSPSTARLKSVRGLATGEALTLPYYRNAMLARWVEDAARIHAISKAVVFSSGMAQYVERLPGIRFVADFVDVDSAKWEQYGEEHAWPLSWVYRREGARLLQWERRIAQRSQACVFVTDAEADLFSRLAPECASKVRVVQNGVDTEFFAPCNSQPDPYRADELPIVFTGAMDYWPNIDAVSWFVREVFPLIAAEVPQTRFYIVGMYPAPTVQVLARDPRIVVTGKVPDVRPYLQHARVVVAPLRVARGMQNKILEAMSMARPIVASTGAAMGLAGTPGVEFESAADAPSFAARVLGLVDRQVGDAMGARARSRVLADYDWSANLQPFARLLEEGVTARVGPRPTVLGGRTA